MLKQRIYALLGCQGGYKLAELNMGTEEKSVGLLVRRVLNKEGYGQVG